MKLVHTDVFTSDWRRVLNVTELQQNGGKLRVVRQLALAEGRGPCHTGGVRRRWHTPPGRPVWFSAFILLQRNNLKQGWQDCCAPRALSGVYQMTAVTVIFIQSVSKFFCISTSTVPSLMFADPPKTFSFFCRGCPSPKLQASQHHPSVQLLVTLQIQMQTQCRVSAALPCYMGLAAAARAERCSPMTA